MEAMTPDVVANIAACDLLLQAIAGAPELFMEIVDCYDYDEQYVSRYFAGLLEIKRMVADA